MLLPEERVWVLGDLIEESGPPIYGSGCYPLDWPGVLDAHDAGLGAAEALAAYAEWPVPVPGLDEDGGGA